jgi:hypothetical protein
MNKVALIGWGKTKNLAPFNDNNFEIWGLNDLYEVIPRWDRWFEIHKRCEIDNYLTRTNKKNYIEGLNSLNCPIYMQDKYKDISCSLPYPLQRMINKYGYYFTSTMAYMLALAIDEGFKEIHLYGIDCETNQEYAEQRACIERLIGYAEGKGIKVYIPNESPLLKHWCLYGYEDDILEKK